MAGPESTAEMHGIFNTTAAEYDQGGVEFFGPIGRNLVEFAAIGRGDRVLDVGCGRGAALLPAAAATGPEGEVIGIDIAENMVSYAERDAREHGFTHVTTQVANGQSPGFPPGHFDVVIGSFSIFIWTYGPADLEPYSRLLRPGGRFAVSAPSFILKPGEKWGFLPEPVHDLLFPHLVDPKDPDGYDCPYSNVRNNWLASQKLAASTLRQAGFTDITVWEEDRQLVLDSGMQWVRWTQTHGMRRLWQMLGEQEREELANEVADRLDTTMRKPDGTLTVPHPVVYASGHAPAQ
ncbi:methyltransferase domain-containing protein [Streptomyces albus subsp. chlorinus]|uniref:class I SAM-dependent methyltransferase n=1 Tax=Streptomyces albus TaxID=1888 RepID=UPI00156E763A|nr:class I SAM-dependent methyltransferase [Streptomyces albus]